MRKLILFLVVSFCCLLGYSKISSINVQSSAELTEWRNNAEVYSFKDYKISYHDSKTARKPVIVFLHGYPTSSWDWRFVWKELEDDFRLVSLDMLGFGLSDKPNDIVYSISEQTDIYQGLLESLSITEAHFVAHDYGDIVAQELLARAAGNKRLTMLSLVMLNGAIFPELHEPLFVQKVLSSPIGGLISRLNSRAVFGANLEKVFGASTKPTETMLDDDWFLAVAKDGHLLNHKLIHYIDERHTFRDRWVGATLKTTVPMILINGSADPVAGKDMVDYYIQLVPNPKVIRLDGVGHFPHLETPLEVVNELRSFLGTR